MRRARKKRGYKKRTVRESRLVVVKEEKEVGWLGEVGNYCEIRNTVLPISHFRWLRMNVDYSMVETLAPAKKLACANPRIK